MNRAALLLVVAVVAVVPGCGADDTEPASRGAVTSDATLPDGSGRTVQVDPEPTTAMFSDAECGAVAVTPTVFDDVQFAFIGTVVAIADEVHPWTTDPENPERPDDAATTPWVTFDVERWYLRNWGTSFSVWMPDIVAAVGDRVAVAGNAFHTEVGNFSGQSGEVDLCTPIPDGDPSPADWDARLGNTIVATPQPQGPPTMLPRTEGTKIFGEQTEPCPPTVLSNDVNDPQRLQSGAACFVAEFDAGRSVTWDVLVPTEEGDPVLTRYDFDGETVTVTSDYTYDLFSNGGVVEQRCTGVASTGRLPVGTDCTSAPGSGFRADSLP